MANKLQVRRGTAGNMPTLAVGEPGFTTDTHEFFIGSADGNIGIGKPMVSITYAALVTLINNSKLTAGHQYRITDYVTTTVQSNTQSAGHAFDIIVVADSVSTLNENARAIRHSGDTYFASSNLAAWRLKYDIHNDTTKYAWADSTNGKGVIYEMTDEFGNTCPYDFKNIQFADYGTYYYTFDVSGADHSLNVSRNYCHDNHIASYRVSPNQQTLNAIIFKNTASTARTYNNIFKINCRGITLGNGCYDNTFGTNCMSIVLGAGSRNNIFKDGYLDTSGNTVVNQVMIDSKTVLLNDTQYSGYTSLGEIAADVAELNSIAVKYVICDRDHDELKIQAALDELRDIGNGGYVYVLGEEITLTNDTPNSLTTPSGYTSVLRVPSKVILDFCGNAVTFSNTTPVQKQYIFYLFGGAKIQNLTLNIDGETDSTINPALIYANNNCVISGCTFSGGYPLNYAAEYSHYIIRLGDNCVWNNSQIATWDYVPVKTPYSQTTRWSFFYAGDGSRIENSRFSNVREDVSSVDTELLAYEFIRVGECADIDHCMFDTVTAQYGRIRLEHRSSQTLCRFMTCDGLSMSGGNTTRIEDNTFWQCKERKPSNGLGWIEVSSSGYFKGNIFNALRLTSGFSPVYAYSNVEISRNTFASVSAAGISGEVDLIQLGGAAYITDNKFKISNASYVPILLDDGDGTSYITGNITVGAKLISDASDTSSSVIANNIVGGALVPTGAA